MSTFFASNIEFSAIWVFLLLPLPLLVRLFISPAPVASTAALRIPFFENLHTGLKPKKKSRSLFRLILSIIIWLLLITTAARPQFVGDTIKQSVTGRSLMMAVDLSGSMREADMIIAKGRVTRLTAVKIVAGDFISKRKGDRIGLILFGSQAYLQAPLTFDRKTVETLLKESSLGLAGRATAIGDAIGLAVKRLRKEDEQDRVLILLTDGANTAGNVDPLKAADLASQEKVKIYTIGVGSPRSSDIDEPTLKAIAEKTNGRYFRARDVEGLLEIYKVLDEIEPVSQDKLSYRPITELFYYPLAIALGLSVLLALIELLSHFIRLPTNLPQNLKKAQK
jgi:Ca-activated chloride channel family protein